MEPHCALKATGQLFKNKGCYHHNANDRLGIIAEKTMFSFWDMSSQGLREKKICRDEVKSVSLYSHYKKTGKGLADS